VPFASDPNFHDTSRTELWCAGIPDSRRASVPVNLFVMKKEDIVNRQEVGPDGHLASFRKVAS
jgi:hypothetical protein